MATYQTICSLVLYLIINVYLLNRIQKYPRIAQATIHLPLIIHFIMFHFLSILDLLLAKLLHHFKILIHPLGSNQFLQILINYLLITSPILFHFALNQSVPMIVHYFLLILHFIHFLIYHSVLPLLYLTALHHFQFMGPLPTSLTQPLLLKSLLALRAQAQVV